MGKSCGASREIGPDLIFLAAKVQVCGSAQPPLSFNSLRPLTGTVLDPLKKEEENSS